MIEDPTDPRLDPVRGLRDASHLDPAAPLIVEGEVALTRALAAGARLEALATVPAKRARLETMAAPLGVPVLEVDRGTLSEAMGFAFHRGCVGWGPRPAPVDSLDDRELDALRTAWRADQRRPVLVLERLADPSNVGALIRSARAFGSPLVLCDGGGADPWSRRAIRASMGNVFAMAVRICPDPLAMATALRETCDAELFAATVTPEAVAVDQLSVPSRPRVLVLGNEGDGLSARAIGACDRVVTVPIDPDADSLNVAAAGTVLLYALSR